MEQPEKKERAWICLLILVAIIILIILPFNLVIAPGHTLRIFDKDANPVPNITVRQIWYQYSLGEHGEVDLTTDSEGKVVIPERIVRTRIISLIIGGINEFENLGIHASYGSSESIGIFASGYQDKWFYDDEGLETGRVSIDYREEINSSASKTR